MYKQGGYVKGVQTVKYLVKAGFPQALEIMENLENHKKSSSHRNIMEFKKNNLN